MPVPDGRDGDAARGFRGYGKSKDHRDDLPQVVTGMAVTGDGIPVRVWCWPGNTNDSALIRQVKDDMRDWALAKIVWVADRGFISAENRRHLRKGDHHYIIGGEAPLRLRGGHRRLVPAGPLPGGVCEPAVEEVRIAEDEWVRDLPQPAGSRAGRRRPDPDARPVPSVV
jgi:hypothetical protein